MEHLIKLYCALTSFKLIKNERGVTALEYALIAAAVVVAVAAGFTVISGQLGAMMFSICDAIGATCGTAPAS